jgi:hypothetical protein
MWLGALAVITLLVSILGGVANASPITGQILDAHTGKPISKAIVLVVWMFAEGAPGLVYSELVGVRETETDSEGRFTVPNLDGLQTERRVLVYKPGHLAWSSLFDFPPLRRRVSPADTSVIRLEPRPSNVSPAEHRFFIDVARCAGLYGTDSAPKFHVAIEGEQNPR